MAGDSFDVWRKKAGTITGAHQLFGGGTTSMRQDAFHWRLGTGTLADEVRQEVELSRRIQANPFANLPAGLRVR